MAIVDAHKSENNLGLETELTCKYLGTLNILEGWDARSKASTCVHRNNERRNLKPVFNKT